MLFHFKLNISNRINKLNITHTIKILSFALLLISSSPLFSEIVEKVNVTGRIFSEELSSQNMVIITQEDIQQLKVKDFADLFSFFTALNVSKRGGAESSYDIGMRGCNFEEVLIMLDGIPLNNPQTGHFNSDFPFSIHDVERLEIIRGGSSTTYGPGAFAGSVNIILKENNNLHFSLTGGDKKYVSTTLDAGKQFKNLHVHFSIDRNSSSGYYEGREFDHWKLTAGTTYKKNHTRIDFNLGYLDKNFGAKDFYAPYPSLEKIKTTHYQLKFQQRYKQFNTNATYTYNKHNDWFSLDRTRPTFFQNESDTFIHYLKLSTSYKNRNGKLSASAGADLKSERMDSSAMGLHKRNESALFINASYLFTPKDGIDIGLRRNFMPHHNSNFTVYAGIFHHINETTVIKAGYGKSFRLPSFTELYYNSPGNIGDENLKPEISHNFETSFTYLTKNYQLDFSLFYRNQENLLDWIKQPSGQTYYWKAVNIEKNDIVGAELTQQLNWKQTRFSLGIERLTTVNNENTSPGFVSKYGLRFPDFSVKVNFFHPLTPYLNFTANYNYKRIYKTTEKGHFLNLVFTVPMKRFEFSLRADNLFNTMIEEIPGLKVPGRWIYLSISYR